MSGIDERFHRSLERDIYRVMSAGLRAKLALPKDAAAVVSAVHEIERGLLSLRLTLDHALVETAQAKKSRECESRPRC